MTYTDVNILQLFADITAEQAVIRANEPTIDELRSRANHPAFAAHQGDDADVVPISVHPRYRARHVVRDQLGLGGRS